jgi:hypothetical protein
MNVANITDSNATVMFSARLRNHRPTVMTRDVIDILSWRPAFQNSAG